MPQKRPLSASKAGKVLGHPLRAALYARVSTHDQQTLPLQLTTMRKYVRQRGWKIAAEAREVGSGAAQRPQREAILKAARRREIDVVLVWRLDRWGRSVADLAVTLKELNELGVAFVSLTEALDLTTSTGRAMAGMLAVFAEFEREVMRERIKAGIAQARKEGRPHGRPPLDRATAANVRKLARKGINSSEIARRLSISRTSVRRIRADG